MPSRPAAATATAMLGPVVARAGFVGVVRGAATTGVADGLAGVPVVVTVSVVTVVAGAEGVDAGVVVSEVGYFLSPRALDRMVDRLAEGLDDDGVVVLCHWRHRIEGWALDGSDEEVGSSADVQHEALVALLTDALAARA